MIKTGPKELLDLTTNTQPLMLTAGIACYRAWIAETGLLPAAAAGHSLGEYTALVAAGALTLAQACWRAFGPRRCNRRLVARCRLGLEAQAVRDGCVQAAALVGEPVEAVNFNDPKQTVIAGTKAAVDKACEVLKAAGAKRALLLSVSAPFHSSLMKPAAEALKARLADTEFGALQFPVINNVDVAKVGDAAGLRDALYRQAFGAVRGSKWCKR
ncbi:ACP S-malonyltransferase [Roseateles sp. GG27B]